MRGAMLFPDQRFSFIGVLQSLNPMKISLSKDTRSFLLRGSLTNCHTQGDQNREKITFCRVQVKALWRICFSRMAGSALKRLMAEYKQLTLNPPEGIIAGPISEDNFFEWEALIMGPKDTVFDGGVFPARLTFPADYPHSPPKMRFTCELFHPNIYPDGRVCISILHAPGDDPMGYEKSDERWSPVQSVEKILLSVVSMLAEPNDESAANVDAAKKWREDRQQFEEIAKATVKKSLGL